MFMLSKSEAAVYLLLYHVNGSLPQRFCSPNTVSAIAVPPVAPGYLQNSAFGVSDAAQRRQTFAGGHTVRFP